ncbi:hypothetical protein ODZ84_09895 [Chryseobacterium fluminis]|nr:hypothetical protein [Chryseobacterium sp. MMS21-Ot14]UZT99844.1 hypothetical protein ODZ84_09895 [Chryseobacterium sp. MMS21-Ot14]
MKLKSTGSQEVDYFILDLRNGLYEYMEELETAYYHDDIDQ